MTDYKASLTFDDAGEVWKPSLDDNSEGYRISRDSGDSESYLAGVNSLIIGNENTAPLDMDQENTIIGLGACSDSNGYRNTIIGYNTASLSSGIIRDNVVIGWKALDTTDITGVTSYNTVLGSEAFGNISGTTFSSIAIGLKAGLNQESGYRTIAIGQECLSNAGPSADYSVAIGYLAGRNTDGARNVAMGYTTMLYPYSCENNIAIGSLAFRGKAKDSDDNIAIGHEAMLGRENGDTKSGVNDNIAIGSGALKFPFDKDIRNIAIGLGAMSRITATKVAKYNICIGYGSGNHLSGGEYNVLIGENTGSDSTGGRYNTAVGTNALSDSTQSECTAVGAYCMGDGSGAKYATSLGFEAGRFMSGSYNTTIGYRAGKYLSSGGYNTAVGWGALVNGEESVKNTCIGFSAGKGIKESSSGNIAIGYLALSNINDIRWFGSNIAIGSESMLDAQGQGNLCIGTKAGAVVPSNYSVMIGHYAGADQNLNDKGFNIYIGYEAGIRSGGVSNGGQVIIGAYAAPDSFQDKVVYVGYKAGKLNQGGEKTTAIGYEANASGGSTVSNGTFVGYRAGYNVADNTNTAIGSLSMGGGYCTGTDNTCLGYDSGYSITSGYDNVYIGKSAGDSLKSGHDNIVIGADADLSSSGIDYTCQLGGSQIIWLRCNDQSINTLSDRRDKTDIIDNPFGLDYINELKTRQFKWDYREGHTKNGKTPAKQGMSEVGFIAQELKETQDKHNGDSLHSYQHHPAEEGSNDYHAMDLMEASMARLLPVAIKAIQELSAKLDLALERIKELEIK